MTNSEAIVKFMYFGHNYPHGFITKVWEGSLGVHLEAKFSSMYQRYGTMTFFSWFMELDEGNKDRLTSWIEANYKN
jgi:hypothetical protein